MFKNLAIQVSSLTKQLQSTQLQNDQAMGNVIQAPSYSCDFCNGPHFSAECQMGNPCGKMSVEQTQYLSKFPQPQFNPYENKFNPS